jgi:hypothetical protein
MFSDECRVIRVMKLFLNNVESSDLLAEPVVGFRQ